MQNPIHIARIGDHDVRFFRSPLQDGRPDLPWHCVDDLMVAMKLSDDLAAEFRKGAAKDWRECRRTVATPEGVINVAPHFMAQGLIGACIDFGATTEEIERQYVRGGIAALDVINNNPDPGLRLAWALEAFSRWEGEAA